MSLLNSLYGQILLIVIIVCGLAWLVSPQTGREVLRRAAFSFLLFTLASILRPHAGTGVIAGTVKLIMSFILWNVAVFRLIAPSVASDLLDVLGGAAIVCLLLLMALVELWSTRYGGVMIVLAAVVLLIVYLRTRSAH